MIEINWDLAPEGADSLKMNEARIIRFFKGNLKFVGNKFVDGFNDNNDWKTIATRPQTKTVADAYEALDYEDIDGHWEQVRYAPKQDYFFVDIRRSQWVDSVFVCTREQFEAYAKEQDDKQEGEKWTHFYGRVKCRIKHVIDEKAWVECESIREDVVKVSELRPIKPKLSQEQAKAVMEFATEHGLITEGQIWTGMERDIIEGPAND